MEWAQQKCRSVGSSPSLHDRWTSWRCSPCPFPSCENRGSQAAPTPQSLQAFQQEGTEEEFGHWSTWVKKSPL